jgi:hypothetical protein
MFLLLITGNCKVRCWGGKRRHKIRNRFREIVSIGQLEKFILAIAKKDLHNCDCECNLTEKGHLYLKQVLVFHSWFNFGLQATHCRISECHWTKNWDGNCNCVSEVPKFERHKSLYCTTYMAVVGQIPSTFSHKTHIFLLQQYFIIQLKYLIYCEEGSSKLLRKVWIYKAL